MGKLPEAGVDAGRGAGCGVPCRTATEGAPGEGGTGAATAIIRPGWLESAPGFVSRFLRLSSVSFEIPLRVSNTPWPVTAEASKLGQPRG